jgi:hypothetical protein
MKLETSRFFTLTILSFWHLKGSTQMLPMAQVKCIG